MPDGKRSSLATEDEDASYYEDDIKVPGKRLPLNVSTRGINLNERLLRAMVANEIKKSLDPEENKKLVANHRPVLHSDNELSNGSSDNEMVVVGVVLNAKQSQNEEVTKALDLLRRNGVTCVYFSLKDSPQSPNGTKKDGVTPSPDENQVQQEKCDSPGHPDTEKKVSSPTVSTTSDYASPPPPSPPGLEVSCTSTTPNEPKVFSEPDPLRGEEGKQESEEDTVPQTLQKTVVESTTVRRKRRRRRVYPYLSRRKAKSKKRKVEPEPEPQVEVEVKEESEDLNVPETEPEPEIPPEIIEPETKVDIEQAKDVPPPPPETKSDPYEFDESEFDPVSPPPLETFKTPTSLKGSSKVGSPKKKRSSKKKASAIKKRSPRKKLQFSKGRAYSPDIIPELRPKRGRKRNEEDSSRETCVQSISPEIDTKIKIPPPVANAKVVQDNDKDKDKLVLDKIKDESQSSLEEKPLCDQKDQVGTADDSKVPKSDKTEAPSASPLKNVQKEVFSAPPIPSDSLQDAPDSMQLRRSSFYSSISRNVKTNLEKYLDGRPQDLKAPKHKKKFKNGFLLHHGDNFPDDPEAPYRLHLATQVLLKLNKRRVKCKPKEDKGKSLLSYLKLQPKRVSRVSKSSNSKPEESEASTSAEPTSVFSGEWTVKRKYICNICGQVEQAFWDMVMHKGEIHPGIVVTHVELIEDPPEGFRRPPSPRQVTLQQSLPSCTKCGISFTVEADLHRHIFECAGNAKVLEDQTKVINTTSQGAPKKRKGKRKRGFKRKINGQPKKIPAIAQDSTTNPVVKTAEITKRRNSEVFKCEFCARDFKTEGWLKNHIAQSHSLPVSIPLEKLSLPTRASLSSSRRIAAQIASKAKQARES